MRQDIWLWVALAATLLSVGAGHAFKASCLDEFDWLCYSDIPVLYDAGPPGGMPDRGLDEGLVPYVQGFNEYPVLTGFWMYAAALLVPDADPDAPEHEQKAQQRAAYYRINAAGLAIVAFATTFLLWRVAEDRRRVLWFALAPSLVLYAFHNWDLLSVLLAVAGLWAHRRGRPLEAGVLFALGASAKIWPGLLLPMIGLEILRSEWRARPWTRDPRSWMGPRSWRFGLGAVGTLGALNAPFLLLNRELYLNMYRFHAKRGPTFESFWMAFQRFTERWELGFLRPLADGDALGTWTRLLLLAGLVLLGWAVWQRRLTGVEASFGAVLVFLLTNQVFSVQYALWLLPFFVVLPIAWERIVLFFATDAFVYGGVFGLFASGDLAQADWASRPAYETLALATTLRHLALATLLAWVVVLALRRWARWPPWRAAVADEAAGGAPAPQGTLAVSERP